jgi:predicted Rossmann fold nucleotide-binding protein DprA/Smf involved in DNA uptake
MATDFLDETRHEIGARMTELKPVVAEYDRLLAAAAALDGIPATAVAPAGAARRAPARAKASGRKRGAAAARHRGRPKGSGKRGEEALALVKERPGITIAEIADTIGIKQNYLYRVLPGLEQDGKVRKEGRGWFPKG